MSDFATMVRRIRTDLNRGSAHDSRIKEAISDAIVRYTPHRFAFNLKRSRTVLTSETEFVSLPTDWIEVDHIRLERADERYPLREVSYDWIEDKQRGRPATGEPTHFSIQNREMRFYPAPDSSYTLVMSFQCAFTNVTASASDAATNAWLTEGEELIRKHAMSEVCVSYIGGDAIAQGLALRQDLSDNVLPAMEMRAAREQSSGNIRGFL